MASQVPNRVFNEAVPADVLASMRDPQRLCPAIAGAALIQGDRLSVRTASQDVEVQAPRSLLAQVYALCDGTRTVNEVVAQTPAPHAQEMAEFIGFLLDQGALVDANLLTLQAVRHAFQGSPSGLVAPSRVSNQLCRRFLWNRVGASKGLPKGARRVPAVPMSRLFEARVSTYTFNDGPVAPDVLAQLAWSIAGVVRTRHERVGFVTPKRTIASAGGMHLLHVFVVLQRPVGTTIPGVYRVVYPAEKSVALQWVGPHEDLLPRAFTKPWELGAATGAFFVVGDAQAAAMRYRNRALQYLFMETGAALHNACLTAPQLGLGFSVIGGYYENIVAHLCRTGEDIVLGSGIFGPRPTVRQVETSNKALDLEFTWVNGNSDRYSMPFHLASARVRTPQDDRPHTWGRDADPRRAYIKAAAEAVEREGYREPRGIRVARFDELDGAVDPATIVRYSEAQYSQADFPFSRFDPKRRSHWAQATDLHTGRKAHVLAEFVFSRSSLAAQGHAIERAFTQVTSSGCAAGLSLDDAALRAMLEVVERDAFMRHWLAQRPGEAIAPAALPAGILRRLDALAQAGCRVCIQRLESPWAHVCLVAAQSETQHFTTMGTAAGPDFLRALVSALEETEARVYAWIHGHAPAVQRPEDVATPEHHFELYSLKKYFRRADRVLFAPPALSKLPPPRRAKDAAALTASFAKAGLRPLVVDITPPNSLIDQGRTSLTAVKAIVPGLVPVSFGYGKEPLGMVSRAHRLAQFPHPFP